MALTTAPKDEFVGFRKNIFNVLLLCLMMVAFLTYFVLTPWLKKMSVDFSVTDQTMTSIAAVYELGKVVGVVACGRLGNTHNILYVTLGAMALYAINAAVLYLYLNNGLRFHVTLDFMVFLMLYFPLSALCIAPQFGLAILKKTNSPLSCKRWVMLQGLFACILQGSSIPLAEWAGSIFGWKSEFLCLVFFVSVAACGLYTAATPAHVSRCDAIAQNTQQLLSTDQSVEGYWSKVCKLLFSHNYRTFQVFNLALGTATANMYLLPMYGMMLLTDSVSCRMSESEAADMVGLTFLPNFGARVLSLLLVSRISSEGFVKLGAVILALGPALGFILGALPAMSVSTTFIVVGMITQAGIGFMMPSCKAGALLEVRDEEAAAANSIVKLSQLVFTAVGQAIATLLNGDAYFMRFIIFLLVCNATCAVFLFWSSWMRRKAFARAPASDDLEANSSDLIDGKVAQAKALRQPFSASLETSGKAVRILSWKGVVNLEKDAQCKLFEFYNQYGFGLLECSQTTDDILDMHKLFGRFVTHDFADQFGRVIIDPSVERCSKNVRDAEAEHQPHTDEAYSNDPGTIITMRCEKAASSGGEVMLISAKAMYDAAVANLAPAALEALFSPCLTVSRALPGSDNVDETIISIFTRCSNGQIGVRWRSRDSYVRIIAEDAVAGYEFLEQFIANPQNRLLVKLCPGQMLIVDNTAIIHGRTPFPSNEERRNVRINYYNNGILALVLAQGFNTTR